MISQRRKRHFYVWVKGNDYWNVQVGFTIQDGNATRFCSVAEAYDQRMAHAELQGVDVSEWELYAVDQAETWEKVREPSSDVADGRS